MFRWIMRKQEIIPSLFNRRRIKHVAVRDHRNRGGGVAVRGLDAWEL